MHGVVVLCCVMEKPCEFARVKLCRFEKIEPIAKRPTQKVVEMRFSIFVIASASLAATAALAQDPSFKGLSLGYNLLVGSNSTEMTADTAIINGLGWTTLGAGLQAAYGFPVGKSIILSVGTTYKISDTSSGDFSNPSDSFRLKIKNSYSVYFEPGYRFGERSLAYAKIGYEGGSMQYESRSNCLARNLEGLGYGLGLRVGLVNKIYLQTEIKQVFFHPTTLPTRTTVFTTSGTQGQFGIGYQF